jgi:hypothetical protein
MVVELWLLVCHLWSYSIAVLRCRFIHGVAHGFLVPQYCSQCSDYLTVRAVRFSARATTSFLAPDCTQCLFWRYRGVSPDVVGPCVKLTRTCMESMEVRSHATIPPDGGVSDEAVATCNFTFKVSSLHWMPGLRRSAQRLSQLVADVHRGILYDVRLTERRYYSMCRRRA